MPRRRSEIPNQRPRKTPQLTRLEAKQLEKTFKSSQFLRSTGDKFAIKLNRSMMEYVWSEVEKFLESENWAVERSIERREIEGIVSALEKLLASIADLRTKPEGSAGYVWYLAESQKLFGLDHAERSEWQPIDQPLLLEERLTILHTQLSKRVTNARRGRPFRDRTNLIYSMVLVYEEAGGTVSASYSPRKGVIDSPFIRFATHLLAAGGKKAERAIASGLAADIRRYLRWSKAESSKDPPWKAAWQRSAEEKRRLMLRFDTWPGARR